VTPVHKTRRTVLIKQMTTFSFAVLQRSSGPPLAQQVIKARPITMTEMMIQTHPPQPTLEIGDGLPSRRHCAICSCLSCSLGILAAPF
jgi:hypothetical protein